MNRIYICIDLKSFYASVECHDRGLDPLKTNLVVADTSRTEKTICLAVSPSLKKYGIGGRARLFEVVQKVKEINKERLKNNNYHKFSSKSHNVDELLNKDMELSFIAAPPRMRRYMEVSNEIYKVYLKYISEDDIYVYSIDEVFCDVTDYLKTYKMSARELITKMIQDVYETTGITATGGIGTNMYLAKVAMDIVAKHVEANEYGVRIAGLDEKTYKKLLWNHCPLTDFWRVGKGYSKRLESIGIYTMGDIARCSINDEEKLFKLFGINAEFLIDHAWGVEPVTMSQIKSFKPKVNSVSQGQVLHCPYNYEKTKLIVKEMVDALVLDLVSRGLMTNEVVLDVGYDIKNDGYVGEYKIDYLGRKVPKHAHGNTKFNKYTSSTDLIMKQVVELLDKIIDKDLDVRRLNVVACSVLPKDKAINLVSTEQLDLFNNEKIDDQVYVSEKEDKLQHVILDIKNKYGKNKILKGMNLEEGGTMIERNGQVGGHKA